MFEILNATKSDISRVVEITKSCIDEMKKNKLDFWDDGYPQKKDFENDLNKCTLYVIKNDKYIIGSVTVDDEMSPEYTIGKWQYSNFKVIHKLMIDPLYQGNGYSKSAMLGIENKYKQNGIDSLRLSVYIKNIAADQLYKRLGYQLIGKTDLRKGPCNLYEKKI